MKVLKGTLFKDWRLKLFSLIIALLLWVWISVSNTVPLIILKDISLINTDPSYTYRMETKRAKIKLFVPKGKKINDLADDFRVYVDVRGLTPGEYLLPIIADDKFRITTKVEEIEPEYIKVRIKEKPQMGH